MSYLPEVETAEDFAPFVSFQSSFGFVPNLFRAQTLLPRLIEAEAEIARAVLLTESALPREWKERILLAVAAANLNDYCVTVHCEMLRSLGMDEAQIYQVAADYQSAGLGDADTELLGFALKLSQRPTWVDRQDFEALRRRGLSDEEILEAVLMTALTNFLCTLSTGLGARPDFESRRIPSRAAERLRSAATPHSFPGATHAMHANYLRSKDLSAESFAPFAFFRERFGFIPKIFRAQTLRPDILEAEARVIHTVLLSDDVLSRVRKEFILLVVSAANLNTYCVAVHCEMLRDLQVPDEVSDQIAVDHHLAGLPEADVALLDFALKLSKRPREYGRLDIEALRRHGFTDEQILEAVVMIALTNFLNTLQMGLGTAPDFEPRRVFQEPGGHQPLETGEAERPGARKLHPTAGRPSPMIRGQAAASGRRSGDEADDHLVAEAQGGDVRAFEELVRRHQGRIYRILLGITGTPEDAEDGTQTAFLKAFQHLGDFQGASKFSTWLTRIAINEGIQRQRTRRSPDLLHDEDREDAEFRPRRLQAWEGDPEQLYSKAQLRELVERGLMKLPAKYRVVVMLRDIEQLSTEEAAASLGLSLANLKSRLLRGRLMLREALAPHFAGGGKGTEGV